MAAITSSDRWLRRFALILALATLVLLALGGLVTSHGVGMAVPDWPNTYGYNMFAFPVSKWVGGILYEHSHRLMAAFVGLLTTILAAWLWALETRSTERWLGLGAIFLVLLLMGARILPVYILLAALALVAIAFSLNRILRQPGTLRWWGILAFAAVILQGVLGGLRVVWFKDQIGIFHAALAQLFFALVCLIAYFTRIAGARPSPGAANSVRTIAPEYSNDKVSGVIAAPGDGRAPLRSLRQLFLTATLLILCQLILGATMRHQHAGLAIPDFPLAYGKVWPAMNAGSIAQYNQQRLETVALNPITAFGVGLQMAHRLTALMIGVLVAGCGWLAWRQLGARHRVTKVAFLWLGLILVQGLLGAATIWSNKAADIATAHVITGALTLALGTLLCAVCSRGVVVAREPAPALTPALFGAQPSAAHAFD